MFLSLFDLFRGQTGLPLSDSTALIPFDAAGIEWGDDGEWLLLRIALPQIDPRSVQVQVTESAFSLAGARSHAERVEKDGCVQSTSSYSAFARTLPLPARVLPGESRTAWVDGDRLEVRLKKA